MAKISAYPQITTLTGQELVLMDTGLVAPGPNRSTVTATTGTLAASIASGVGVFTATHSGVVPASGGGTATALRADATFTNVFTGTWTFGGVTATGAVSGATVASTASITAGTTLAAGTTVTAGTSITVTGVATLSATGLIPAGDNTTPLGSSSFAFSNAFLGTNHAPVLDTVSGNIGYYARTTAEISASVTPTNYVYAPLDIRRYGGDPTGSTDSTSAVNALLSVLLQLGGGSAVIWPGTYKITSTVTANFAPNTGPTAATYGISLYAHGVIFNFTGTGYAFDFFAPNTSATFGFPLLQVYGSKLIGTASATGGWRTRSMNSVRFFHSAVQGFTSATAGTGAAWTVLNDANWSENCHWRGCSAVNCQTGIAFQRNGGTNSFARTYVDGFFGAGITGYWFDVGGTISGVGASSGCSVYDARFTHISGNFTSLALFGIGNSTNPSDMTASVVDGVDTEVNSNVALAFTGSLLAGATSGTLTSAWSYPSGTYTAVFSDAETRAVTLTQSATTCTWTGGLSNNVTANATIQQGIFQLRDYPQNSGVARRPVAYNVGSLAQGSGVAIWISNVGAVLTAPESVQTQQLVATTGLQAYEPAFGVAAVETVATYDSVLQSGISVTGYASPPSGRVIFSRAGNQATLKVFDPLTGTSNANSLTLTTIPTEYRPATQCYVTCNVEDNGVTNVPAIATIATSGVITFSIYTSFNTASATGFTTSGVKGLPAGNTITWPLT